MSGLVLHVNAVSRCTHQGQAQIAPSQARVLVSGNPVATMESKIAVAGCPFQVPVPGGTKPQPCLTVQWTMPSTRVLVDKKPAMLLPMPGVGPGTCLSAEQIPQGPPTVTTVQLRVIAT